MYLPSKDLFKFLKTVLIVVGVEHKEGKGGYGPVLTFYFEGKFCWVIELGSGYSIYCEDPEKLKSFEKIYYSILEEYNKESNGVST